MTASAASTPAPISIFLPSFRSAWRKGQRCIIPAEGIFEPMTLVDSPADAAEYLAGWFHVKGEEVSETS